MNDNKQIYMIVYNDNEMRTENENKGTQKQMETGDYLILDEHNLAEKLHGQVSTERHLIGCESAHSVPSDRYFTHSKHVLICINYKIVIGTYASTKIRTKTKNYGLTIENMQFY